MSEQLQLEQPSRGKPIGYWQVRTQRENEYQRTGIGASDLRRTLEHLRRRGDVSASYLVDMNAGWVHVTLGEIPIGGTSA